MRGQRLAFWGSQPGLERSTETPATGQRSKAEAQLGHGFYRSSTFLQGLRAVVGAGDSGKASAGVVCDSHRVSSAAAGIGILADYVMWEYVAAALAADCEIWLVDLPGCGESDAPKLTAMGDRVWQALRQCLAAEGGASRGQITLIGHASRCWWRASAAIRRRDRLPCRRTSYGKAKRCAASVL